MHTQVAYSKEPKHKIYKKKFKKKEKKKESLDLDGST